MPNGTEALSRGLVRQYEGVRDNAWLLHFPMLSEETDGVERTYGHRYGDFVLLSSFPFEDDCPHGTGQHDAIGAVKPLSPLDSRGTVHRRHGARNCGSYCRVVSGSITDGGIQCAGKWTTGSSPSRRKRKKIESRKNNELALSTSSSAKPIDKAKAPTQRRSKRPRLQSRPPTTN